MSLKNIIKNFVEKSLGEKPTNIDKIELDQISDDELNNLNELIGSDLAGYKRIIDNYAVRHTHKKHGQESTEKPRGQIAVQSTDFELISEIIETPDEQKDGGKNNIGRQTLISSKNLEKGIYVYVEEIRNKQKEMAMQTLYIKKKKD